MIVKIHVKVPILFTFTAANKTQMNEKSVIIVAGGSGKRMGSEIPKQFLLVVGKPVLMHTLEVFYNYDPDIEILLVLPENQHNYWLNLCDSYNFNIKHTLAKGGSERFYSVKNGLEKIQGKGMVAVHDGVRPLVSKTTIDACFAACMNHQAVIPVIAATESIRKIENNESQALNRSLYFMVQTPQVFELSLLKKAYGQEFDALFTDDASLVERLGHKIYTVEGNPENIKITRPLDLKIANALLA